MNKQGIPMSDAISAATLTTHSSTAATIGSALVITSTFALIAVLIVVGVLAALVMMALTPPRSGLEFAGMLAMAVSTSVFGGPLAIEWLSLGWLSIHAQIGFCFIAAAPAWLVARIVANQLSRWRDAKNPIGTITRDVREARRG